MPTYPGRITEPRARSTDPQTSHDAGAKVNAAGQRAVILGLMSQDRRVHGDAAGCTADELDAIIGGRDPKWLRTTAGRRLSELKRRGLVEVCGERKTRSGRKASVYRVVG